jgi:hypothetical protein
MSTQLLARMLAFLVCFAIGSLVQAADPQMHKGTVLSASAGRLVMKDHAGKEQYFAVTEVTKVTVNGKPGKLEDLQETMPVQVTTDEKGKVLAVSTIDKEKIPVLVAAGASAPRLGSRQVAKHSLAVNRL